MRIDVVPCIVGCLVASLFGLPDSPRAAADDEPPTEVGILLGAGFVDSDVAGYDSGSGEIGPVLGVRAARRFGRSIVWFADSFTSRYDTTRAPGKVEGNATRTGLEYLFPSTTRARWFVSAAAGVFEADYEIPIDFDRPLVSVGFGKRRSLASPGSFRWEVRVDRVLGEDGIEGRDVVNAQALVGWSLGLRFRRQTVDTDADGVVDQADQCAGTPSGAVVDSSGCPIDTDRDGVWDGQDQCPETPRNVRVDASGCFTDEDGDGIADGIDRCATTPRGAVVDSRGCPMDSDGDGVPDGVDLCPDTPRDVMVGMSGCTLDTDGDGVPNGRDRCLDTPKGTPVDEIGCPAAAPRKPKSEALFSDSKNTLILEGVSFRLNRAELTPESLVVLDRIAASLADWPEVRVEVGGHTDSSGSDALNQRLSEARAEAVRAYLLRAGVAASRLEARGYGETRPIDDNGTADGRARNRRVEFTKVE